MPSASEIIVRDILRGLYDGRYDPGQRLVESQLTATYATSRGPVREALNTLAAMGVVDLALARGAQVKILAAKEAIDILVVAQALIGTAARLAVGRIEQPNARADLGKVMAALTRFDPSSMAGDYAVARNNFYATLTRIANNMELSRILPTVQIQIIRVQFRSALRMTDPSRHADYRRIVDAVLAGRADEAEAAARQHLGRAIERLVDLGSG